jgi:hypothetical protein
MPDDKLFFKNPATGEFQEDRRGGKIEYTLAKVELTLNTLERGVEARLASFETLLRERLDHTCSEVEDVRDDSKQMSEALKESFRTYSNTLIEKQKTINKGFNERLITLEKLEPRIEALEIKPTKNKAKIFDKVVFGIGGILLTLFLSHIQEIFNLIINVVK